MFKNISTDEHIPQIRGDIEGEMRKCEEKKYFFYKMEMPLTLKPETCTFEDIKIHAITQQYLHKNTVEKHIRYLKFMANHEYPVQLRPPDKNNFLMHIRYRLFHENPPAGVYAIRHEWEAIRMLLRSYGIRPWDIKLPPTPQHKKRNIPLPETAHEYWHYKFSKKRYERKLYQYIFFYGFMLGMRPPAEICNLHTYDIQFLKNKKAIITITEPKKHESQRQLPLNYQLATDPLHKSLKNWMNSWRNRVENHYSDDYLFIQPSGKPFTPRFLGKKLSSHGKKIWKYFTPYCMRHWNAIAKLIETKIQTGDYQPYTVKNWMGHETIKTTEQYIKYAEQYYDLAPYSWIHRVLKHPKQKDGGKHDKTDNLQKKDGFGNSNRRNTVWARRHFHRFTDKIKRIATQKNPFVGFSIFIEHFKIFLFSLYITFKNSCHPTKNNNQPDRRWTI